MGIKRSQDPLVNCIHLLKFFGPLQKDKQATILFSTQQPGAEDSKCWPSGKKPFFSNLQATASLLKIIRNTTKAYAAQRCFQALLIILRPSVHIYYFNAFQGYCYREERHSPDMCQASAHAVLFPYLSITHSALPLLTAHLHPPTKRRKPPAELKQENLKIANTAGSLKRKQGWENEGKSSRSQK